MSESSVTEPKGRPTPKRPPSGPTAPQTAPQQPTSAREWRSARRNGVPVTLPSGQACRLRRTFNMVNMIETGEIPNPLGGYITEAVRNAQADGKPEEGQFDLKSLDQSTPEGKLALAQFLELMMRSMSDIFVEPRVLQVPEGEDAATWEPGYRNGVLVDEEELDCLSVVDIDTSDQLYAFSWAQGGVQAMATFREGPAEGVEPAPDGADVQVPTI